ncbi:acyl-ACP thioesterase [Flavobacterium cauense R2A-7]|uniref:Acyl-ACP thioesterase n=1 Tax=Flavobacterium cauense R2A-7 TaxID=1341154 RepID=V6RZ25_9FLAO|nr:acyl-ACP thioesterase domain-containing protein [Flavobacterium cauense]ESU19277.1 acyl-ACP thioesterase [Flavobacterium cauense R2A-7]KGO82106.1 acyl-ACP thioesterase [Flavobacterium cauense R2A-7]TWI15054.1 acyl-ACP thioesterase [Flavobacterium cauense R2A-7]
MPISPNFTSLYSHEWEINFTQCAPNGFLKYVDLCNLLQLTAAEHSILGGLSFNDMQQHHQAWVLSRIRVEIETLPKWMDKVTVKTWIELLDGNKSIRNIEMYLDGKKIVGATTYWAVLNTKLRKSEPLALPHEHFEKYVDRKATSQRFMRINVLQETEKIADRTVVLSDLDIVNHVNNTKYLEWCLDTLNPKTILKQEIKNLEMNFLRELNWNDKVELHSDDKGFFTVTKDEKVCFALVLERK